MNVNGTRCKSILTILVELKPKYYVKHYPKILCEALPGEPVHFSNTGPFHHWKWMADFCLVYRSNSEFQSY